MRPALHRRHCRETRRNPAIAVRRADDNTVQAQPVERRPQRRQQRRGDEDRRGAAVLQDVAGDVGRQQRIDRHRNDAGTQRAQNAIGKSTVSSMTSATRRSRSMPAASSPAANRAADAASSA